MFSSGKKLLLTISVFRTPSKTKFFLEIRQHLSCMRLISGGVWWWFWFGSLSGLY